MESPKLLEAYLKRHKGIAVAFSGGVDSSYLLYAAKAARIDVRAYFVKSQFQPEFELRDAERIAELAGAPMTVLSLDALSVPQVPENAADRCYHCKKAILAAIEASASADGFAVVCDGTNADDSASDRPGMRALLEAGVISPLRDCGLSKADIRRLSKLAGLFTHDKPSYSCLATRIPTGTTITDELLDKLERAERALFELGFSDFRVRLIPPDTAKLQLRETQWEKCCAMRVEILTALRDLFETVTVDFETRGG